jgi:hypothetical protein
MGFSCFELSFTCVMIADLYSVHLIPRYQRDIIRVSFFCQSPFSYLPDISYILVSGTTRPMVNMAVPIIGCREGLGDAHVTGWEQRIAVRNARRKDGSSLPMP